MAKAKRRPNPRPLQNTPRGPFDSKADRFGAPETVLVAFCNYCGEPMDVGRKPADLDLATCSSCCNQGGLEVRTYAVTAMPPKVTGGPAKRSRRFPLERV